MPRAPQITPQLKHTIIGKNDNGCSNRQVAKHIGAISPQSLRIISNGKRKKSVKVKMRSKRPRKTDEKNDQLMKKT